MTKYKVCCICGSEIRGFGNNANPLAFGLCCDRCNKKVILERLSRIPELEKINNPKRVNQQDCLNREVIARPEETKPRLLGRCNFNVDDLPNDIRIEFIEEHRFKERFKLL